MAAAFGVGGWMGAGQSCGIITAATFNFDRAGWAAADVQMLQGMAAQEVLQGPGVSDAARGDVEADVLGKTDAAD